MGLLGDPTPTLLVTRADASPGVKQATIQHDAGSVRLNVRLLCYEQDVYPWDY